MIPPPSDPVAVAKARENCLKKARGAPSLQKKPILHQLLQLPLSLPARNHHRKQAEAGGVVPGPRGEQRPHPCGGAEDESRDTEGSKSVETRRSLGQMLPNLCEISAYGRGKGTVSSAGFRGD